MTSKRTLQSSLERFDFSTGQRIALLLCNYIPILHVLLTACTLCVPWATLGWRIAAALTVLYMMPPVLARCILSIRPIREERIRMPSRDYFTWWILLNLQVVFCRLPFLEELMRLIPCAYSAWLRLWGARVGSFTYWAAGLQILDRGFLDIGDGVVFGAGVRLNPHVIVENDDGRMELLLARIRIGHRALIGGYALLTAGTRIADEESTRACLRSAPFNHWKDGRKVKQQTLSNSSGES